MTKILNIFKNTLQIEAQSILDQIDLADNDFEKAVELIAVSKGRLIVTGMGKSGIIGKKIAATLASTGTPSFFLHPGEAFHGDLGIVTPEDVILALSYSGETDELLKIIPFFKDNLNPIIAISGNGNSTLARNSDIHLYIRIEKEACPLSLAPTSSTTVTLALGDAIAMALMEINGFKHENFARFHPGGSLGRRLLSNVETVMRTNELPIVEPKSSLTDIIHIISHGKLGMALVNEGSKTIGIITDGDLRRLMELKGKDAFDSMAEQIMTNNPKKIQPKASLHEAEEIFNLLKINSLVVANDKDETLGVIQIYNL